MGRRHLPTGGAPVPLWVLVLLCISLMAAKASGSGVFELYLKSLENPGLNSEGNCCSGVRRAGQCTSTCRTFFRVCLNHYQTSISEHPTCTFGSLTTEVLGQNSFQFPVNRNAFTNPIRLPFDFSWPGTFTLIIEAWHDQTLEGPTPGSPRELVLREKVGRSVIVGEDWSHFTFTPPQVPGVRLDYKYRVICDADYFGPGCSVVCRPRDDELGHYRCTENGTKACLDGWTGPYCDKAICLPGCHPSNGICDRPNECQCRLGWQGKFCDKCIPYPGCQHGTCTQPWECKCGEGWGGLFCNQDLNYCTHYTPCKNGATCTNTGEGSYTCSCPPSTTGTNCEIALDDCQHQPCQNGGTCSEVGSSYQCQCPLGFNGRHCESSAQSCEESPCKNGAPCVPYTDSYKCLCQPGFTGVNCQIEIDECASNPCQKNGRCVDELNGFRCVCQPGFSGALCEKDNDNCSNTTCLNGGTCQDRVNDFVCRCVPGFVGPLCQTNVDDCESKPCANGGVCHDLVNDFRCDCAAGFADKDCRKNVEECAAAPCQNGGTCHDLIADYSCTCPPGYTGKSCEWPPGVKPHLPYVPTTGSDVTGTHAPGSGGAGTQGAPTSARPGISSGQGGEEGEKRVVTMQQLLLIICLGVGIPIVIIIIIIVFLLCNKRRSQEDSSGGVRKENEQNEINSINNLKCVDSNIINTMQPSLKLTNEEQDSSRTFKLARQQLNLDQCTLDKSSNKTFLKDYYNTTDIIKKKAAYQNQNHCGSSSSKNNSLERESTSIESTSVDISGLHKADVHPKPYNSEANSNSILYLEKNPRHPQPYSEGMLATEV